jgi:GT2 family glycosyltransferase
MKKIAFVATSCGRLDLLRDTVASFLDMNTYPVSKYIVVEDGPTPGFLDCLRSLEKEFDVSITGISKPIQVGQHDSCDVAYRNLGDTEYVFHCEDDWLFTRKGFVEDSIRILEEEPRVLTVWLRDKWHYVASNYPRNLAVIGTEANIGGVGCYHVNFNCGNPRSTSGFTFNPGLRRYQDFSDFKFLGYRSEFDISLYFSSMGRYSVCLKEFAVVHIGDNRHVVPTLLSRLRRKLIRMASFSRFRR